VLEEARGALDVGEEECNCAVRRGRGVAHPGALPGDAPAPAAAPGRCDPRVIR
jgi:hypothetical protein